MNNSIEKLAIALERLGSESISVFYIDMILRYGTLWVIIGLCVWGFRALCKNDVFK